MPPAVPITPVGPVTAATMIFRENGLVHVAAIVKATFSFEPGTAMRVAQPEPILTRAMVEAALKARRRRPMFIVDLAVPRDVEASVAKMGDVFLYTIDDLGGIVQQGMESRHAAVADAEAIVARQVQAFRAWQGARAAAPAIVELRRRADQYRDAELARAKARLARGEDPAAVLESLAKGLANKFLHHPTQALSRAQEEDREQLLRAIERLYPEPEHADGEGEP